MPLFPAISHRSSAGWLQVLRTPPLRSGRKRCGRLLRRTGLYQKAAIGAARKRWRRQCAKKRGRNAAASKATFGQIFLDHHSVQRSPLQYPRPSCSRNVMPGPGRHSSS
jgi:hypothetical protein